MDSRLGRKWLNRTVADLREIVKGGQGVDPLKDFSEAAREEPARVRAGLGGCVSVTLAGAAYRPKPAASQAG
jgi:hypothetical protein